MTVHTIKLVPKPTLQTKDQACGLETVATALICQSSLLRSGLQQILRGSVFVVAEADAATNSRMIQDAAPEPALVIIEANQDTSRMLEAVRAAKQQSPEVRVVVLTNQFDLGFVRIGHEAGVDGFCEGASAPEILIKSLEIGHARRDCCTLGDHALAIEWDDPEPRDSHSRITRWPSRRFLI